MFYSVKFFKSHKRAVAFAEKVNGEILNNKQWEYDIELKNIEYSEDLKEMFPYIVVWQEWTTEEIAEHNAIIDKMFEKFNLPKAKK